jgi:hypothetical protein
MLGEYSTKTLLIWLGGMLVAAAIAILISFYVVDHFLAAHNQQDPVTKQGGLKFEQDIRRR